MAFQPSPYQQAVFDFIEGGQGSALINAVAGAGKTTTIVEAVRLIPPGRAVTFLAFNKRIVTELKNRKDERGTPAIPNSVRVQTFHSAGFGAWRYAMKNVRDPDGNKNWALLEGETRLFSARDVDTYGAFAVKLVGLAKNAGIGCLIPDNEAEWQSLIDHHGLDLDSDHASFEEGIVVARRLFKVGIERALDRNGSYIDFDDMIFMPIYHNVRFFQNDVVFVDEAQDTNATQLAMLRRMLKPAGRLIAVGDPNQAIYGFRGADSNAFYAIRDAFSCVELPLSISYRCAQSVVRYAQTLVPHIEAHAGAPEGSVETKKIKDVKFGAADVVICRNTAPLMALAYDLIGRKIACKVLGRDIGRGLVQLVKKMKARDLDQLEQRLTAYEERETARLIAKGQETRAEAIRDRCACVRVVSEGVTTDLGEEALVADVVAAIEALFSDDDSATILTLCTGHKAKGLEWNNVHVLAPELMPSRYARQEWQKEQEAHLQYVVYTRAKQNLIFLTGGVK